MDSSLQSRRETRRFRGYLNGRSQNHTTGQYNDKDDDDNDNNSSSSSSSNNNNNNNSNNNINNGWATLSNRDSSLSRGGNSVAMIEPTNLGGHEKMDSTLTQKHFTPKRIQAVLHKANSLSTLIYRERRKGSPSLCSTAAFFTYIMILLIGALLMLEMTMLKSRDQEQEILHLRTNINQFHRLEKIADLTAPTANSMDDEAIHDETTNILLEDSIIKLIHQQNKSVLDVLTGKEEVDWNSLADENIKKQIKRVLEGTTKIREIKTDQKVKDKFQQDLSRADHVNEHQNEKPKVIQVQQQQAQQDYDPKYQELQGNGKVSSKHHEQQDHTNAHDQHKHEKHHTTSPQSPPVTQSETSTQVEKNAAPQTKGNIHSAPNYLALNTSFLHRDATKSFRQFPRKILGTGTVEFDCDPVDVANACYDIATKSFVRSPSHLDADPRLGDSYVFATRMFEQLKNPLLYDANQFTDENAHRNPMNDPAHIHKYEGKQGEDDTPLLLETPKGDRIVWWDKFTIITDLVISQSIAHFWMSAWPILSLNNVVRNVKSSGEQFGSHINYFFLDTLLYKSEYEKNLWSFMWAGITLNASKPEARPERQLKNHPSDATVVNLLQIHDLEKYQKQGANNYYCFKSVLFVPRITCKNRVQSIDDIANFKNNIYAMNMKEMDPFASHCKEVGDRNHIYLMQRKTKTRRIDNIEEVVDLIARVSKKTKEDIVVFDSGNDHKIVNDIKLFKDITILIGVHGAGWVNEVWLPVGAHVLEIYPLHFTYEHMYQRLAWDTGLIYFNYMEKSNKILHQEHPEFENYTENECRHSEFCRKLGKTMSVHVTLSELEPVLERALVSWRKICL